MNNKHKYIEDLLNRFLEGETSNGEEKELYAFFKNEKLSDHLAQYKPAFKYFEKDLNEELRETATEIEITPSARNRRIIRIIIATAAVLAVILSLPLFTAKEGHDLYEVSYMIKNGVISYDMNEIEKELRDIEQIIATKEKQINDILSASEYKTAEYREINKRMKSLDDFL